MEAAMINLPFSKSTSSILDFVPRIWSKPMRFFLVRNKQPKATRLHLRLQIVCQSSLFGSGTFGVGTPIAIDEVLY